MNNGNLSESPKKISKAQTYRLLNCIKVLDYLKDYEIQPCNERICRALKQYGKNKENIRLLWEQVLSYVNNKKEAINSILVKNIWIQMNNNKNVYENINNNYNINNDNVQQSYPSNNNYMQEQMTSYPTPDKTIFIKELNINNKCTNNYTMNNSFLPSPEFKPIMIENSYNSYQNNINKSNDNNRNNNSEKESSEFKCTYPALYKPAWTISMEQLRSCNNTDEQYPSPVSATFTNNYNMNYNY